MYYTPAASDSDLDRWIRDALLEDAVAQPPTGAWERLRQAITDSQRYGMWILDEPLRDPPESTPAMLSRYQFHRALRLYDDARHNSRREVREVVWNNVMPMFFTLVHL
ncbi:MAG: hypothetical protein JXQ72_12825 [Anaerolineae bacterium]|nr:hypothetical protein [Anaerolineae bacterium]